MKRIVAVLFMFTPVLCAFTLPGCPPFTGLSEDELNALYACAVADAAVAEPSEICRNLTAITADTPGLLWEGAPGNSRIRVVTWTSWTGYDDLVGKSICLSDIAKASYLTTRDTWVTLAPQIQEFVSRHYIPQEESVLRMEQLLGVPPNNGKTRFVEFYVNPSDLFRPAPDPEITDHEAGLDFPVSCHTTVNQDYMDWFNALKASSYGDNGYPWTRLGYTYDWGSFSHVGLSEFIIRTGATVEVFSVTLNDLYLFPEQ